MGRARHILGVVTAVLWLLPTVTMGQTILELAVPDVGSASHDNKASELVRLKPGYSFKPDAGSGNVMHAFIDPSIINETDYADQLYGGGGESWPPQIDPSKAVGFTPGSHSVTPTGAAAYDIPIQLPPGTAGIAPSLSISYNSQSGNGLLGMGWNIAGLSAITRVPNNIYNNGAVKGVKLDHTDVFALDGNRLIATSGAYGQNDCEYGTEQETFSQIKSYGYYGTPDGSATDGGPEWFEVKTKEGMTLQYGNSEDSRFWTGDGSKVIVHRINKMIDQYGNYVTFKYRNIDRQSVIEEIRYTGNAYASVEPYNVIQFEYDERQDKNTVYVNGPNSDVKSNLLLRKIRIIADGQHFKNYVFEYGFKRYSFLKSVTESGTNGEELNSTVMKYGDEQTILTYTETEILTGFAGLPGDNYFLGDYNGDGLTDIMTMEVEASTSFILHPGCQEYLDQGDYGYTDVYTGEYGQCVPVYGYNEVEFTNSYMVDESFCECWLGYGLQEVGEVESGINQGASIWGWNEQPVTSIWYPLIELKAIYSLYLKTSPDGDFVEADSIHLSPGAFHALSQEGRTFTVGRSAVNGFDRDVLSWLEIEPALNDEGDTTSFSKLKKLATLTLNANGELEPTWVNVPGTFAEQSESFSMIKGDNPFINADFIGNGKNQPILIKVEDFPDDFAAYMHTSSQTFKGVNFTEEDVSLVVNADNINLIDFNGDGKTDLMATEEGLTKIFTMSWNAATLSVDVEVIYSSGFPTRWHKIVPGDFNGDGKTDLMTFIDEGIRIDYTVAYSNGVNFDETVFPFSAPFDSESAHHQLRTGDFNGDGLTDVLHTYPYPPYNRIKVYLSLGKDRFHIDTYDTDDFVGLLPIMTGDFNGDGKTDIFHRKHWQEAARTHYFNKDAHDLSLTEVFNGFGLNTKFNYSWLTKRSGFSGSGTTPNFLVVQTPMQVVSSVSTPNGAGGASVSVYSFLNATVHKLGKGFVGFGQTTVTNASEDRKTVSTFGLNTSKAFRFLLNQRTSTLADVLIAETVVTEPEVVPVGPAQLKRYWLKQGSSTSTDYLTGFTSTTAYGNYDAFGNARLVTTTSGNETTTVTSQFGAYGSSIPSRPETTTVSVNNGVETYTRKVNYEYNAQGGLTKEIRDPDPDSPTVTTLYEQIDDFGNARKVTVSAAGVPSRVTQYQYDPKGRFATRVTNTLGQHANYTYDGRWGQPLTVTDITGLTASSQYDAFGRLKQSTDPLGHTSTTTMAWDMGTFGTSVYRIETQSPGAPDGKVWMDAYNREVRSEAEGFDVAVVASKQYDPRGRTLWGAVPNPKTGGGQQIEQMFSYDNYNRIQSVSDGTRTTSSAFTSAGSTYNATVIDPGGRQRTQKTDATGKVIESTDPGGNLTFAYHANGKVKKTTGSGPSVTLTEMTYDDFGNQETLKDIDGGLTQYRYNPLGELTLQIDALENEHTMEYDAMGRITERSGPDGTVTYQYVTQGNGLNQLRKATFVSGGTTTKQEYTYDEFGRVLSKKETIQDDAVMVFTTSYTYDDLGRVATMTYPSGLVLSYEYDANSHLKKVKNGGTDIYELEGKNAVGQVTEYTLGNGVTTTKTINEHGHLTEIFAAGVQHLTMEFDPLTGNLNWRKNNLTHVQEDFSFDYLDRLEFASVDENYVLEVDYDNNGNIDIKSDAGVYAYDDDRIHAVRSITNEGENISLVEQNITYTPWGRRTATINEDINNAVFTYGPDNERKKLAMQVDYTTVSTRYYSGNYEEYQAPNGDVYKLSYVSGGDGLCAIHVVKNSEQPQFYYVYKDHLGSILALTDDEGDIEGEQSFDAWGRYRDPATWEVLNSNPFDDELDVVMPEWFTRGYTGHEHMQKFDLINMNGRMYDPLQARMLAVDNYVQDSYNTQAYNRYSYVWNNPLSYTDPTGEYLIEYLTQAYNKNTWDPFGWGANGFSGGFTVGFSSMGGGSSFFAGGSLSSGSLYVVGGMNTSTGVMGGGISGNGGIPSYNEPMRAWTGSINMSAVDWYRPKSQQETLPAYNGAMEDAILIIAQINDHWDLKESGLLAYADPKPKGKGSGGFNQQNVDFAGAVGGGLTTVFGAASKYSGFLKAADRIGYVGAVITVSGVAHAKATGQLKTSHKVDAAITIGLTVFSSIPFTSGIAIPVSFIYGGVRLVGGEYIDQKINTFFPNE